VTVAVLALAALVLVPGVAAADAVTELHYVMGTWFRITVEGETARPAMRRCFQEARRLEAVFSRFDPDSELSRVNAARGEVTVSDDFAHLLRRSGELAAASDGAFDVSVGALTELWRRAGAPDAAGIGTTRASVGGAHVRLAGNRLRLAPGTRLDFDGIAKGYAVDACTRLLRGAGVRAALVNLGESSVYALGAPAGASHWELALRGIEPEEAVGTLRLRDQAASISATFGARGPGAGRVGHIVDPRTGMPLGEPAVAVALAGSATDAEAWSKVALLWGRRGLPRLERQGVRALHVGAAGAFPPGVAFFRPYQVPRPLSVAAGTGG
jgi:thiamine biosynthesis lipoprotein